MANRRFIDFPIASTSGDTDIILIWQGGANKQTTKATFLSGLPENLDELNDVAISGLTNGQILRYDSVTGKWENTDQGNLDLNDLNDVSIVSPSNGQVLVYNSSTSQWENSSGGFVPYVGAVTTVDLGAQGLRAGYVRFDTSIVGVPNEQGLMFWDADDETVDIILNGYTMKIGEDLFYPVKNQTGSTIAKGVAVRFNGTVGASGRLLIAPFIADGSVPSSRFMGVTAEEILNGEDGKVLFFGRIRGINTNAFNEGDILYASTTVAGGYQTAIPVSPNNIVQVAAVVTKSATVGTIFVRPTLGSNINKDEGVKIVSVADKNLLQYQSGTSLWENKSLAQVLGGTSAQFVKGDGSLDSTSYGTGTVTSVGLSSATSGVTIGSSPVTTSGTITLAIATASGSQNGLLSSTDWTTFNSKQNALTNPVTGTGTSGQVAYFTGTSAISSESNLFWDATNDRLGIGVNNPLTSIHIIKALGNDVISIGETSNSQRLVIGQETSYTGNYINSTNVNLKLQSYTDGGTGGNIIFQTGIGTFSTRLTITNTGASIFTSSITASSFIKSSGTSSQFLKADGSVDSTSYQTLLTNPVTGTGTTNYLPKFTGSTTIGNSNLINDASGNVGIGVTPNSWGSSFKPLQMGSYGSFITGRTDDNSMFIGKNVYFDGSNWIGTTTGWSQQIVFDSSGNTFFRNINVTANTATGFNNQLYLASSGNVLIGTTTDSGAKLNVRGSSNANPVSIEADAGGNQLALTRIGAIAEFYMGGTTFGSTQLVIRSGFSGGVLLSAGSTAWVSASDIRLKNIGKKIENAIENLSQLQTIYYSWKNSTNQKEHLGLIAQEVEKQFPEIVTESEIDGMKGVNYTELIPVLIAAVKELKQEIDTLKN